MIYPFTFQSRKSCENSKKNLNIAMFKLYTANFALRKRIRELHWVRIDYTFLIPVFLLKIKLLEYMVRFNFLPIYLATQLRTLRSMTSVLCTATNNTPYERMFTHQRRAGTFGGAKTLTTWLISPGKVFFGILKEVAKFRL